MQKILMKKSIKELLDDVKNQNLIREVYQRTPSHSESFATDIIQSIKNDNDAMILHIAKTEQGKNAILDGSSRLADIQNYVENKIGLAKNVVNTYTDKNGNTIEKSEKVKKFFKDLTETEKNEFLSTKIDFVLYEGLNTIQERYKYFLKLNNSTALSTCQKSKGLSSDLLENINNKLNGYNFIKHFATDRAIQKDEIYSVSVLILANIADCYNSSYAITLDKCKELTEEEFNFDRFSTVCDLIENAYNNEELTVKANKYNYIHLIVNLYGLEDNQLLTLNIDNNLLPDIDTKGANSKTKNDDRNKLLLKCIKKQLKNKVATVPTTTKTEEVELSDII